MTTFKKCGYDLDGVKCDTIINRPFIKIRLNPAGLGNRHNRGTVIKVCDYHYYRLKEEDKDVSDSIDYLNGGWIPGSKDESKKSLPAQVTIRNRNG